MKYDLNNLTQEQLEQLRNEICLGSLYTSDFENSFDIPADICQGFFDGFNDYLGELMVEDGHGDDEYWDIIDSYDTPENLMDWYNCCEYPFGEELYFRSLELEWTEEDMEDNYEQN